MTRKSKRDIIWNGQKRLSALIVNDVLITNLSIIWIALVDIYSVRFSWRLSTYSSTPEVSKYILNGLDSVPCIRARSSPIPMIFSITLSPSRFEKISEVWGSRSSLIWEKIWSSSILNIYVSVAWSNTLFKTERAGYLNFISAFLIWVNRFLKNVLENNSSITVGQEVITWRKLSNSLYTSSLWDTLNKSITLCITSIFTI